MYRQGASVALTGITKAVAFLGPVIVLHIPALMDFCIVAAIAIFFELVLALFAFNACLVSGGPPSHTRAECAVVPLDGLGDMLNSSDEPAYCIPLLSKIRWSGNFRRITSGNPKPSHTVKQQITTNSPVSLSSCMATLLMTCLEMSHLLLCSSLMHETWFEVCCP